MYVKHNTTKVEGATPKKIKEFDCTVIVGDTVHKNAFTVERPTIEQARQAAWVHVEENQEKYGIDDWQGGKLSIEVTPNNS